ncbi:hypothetical protein ACWGIU_36405, partial [Streptomyces sp. NPDC054840]
MTAAPSRSPHGVPAPRRRPRPRSGTSADRETHRESRCIRMRPSARIPSILAGLALAVGGAVVAAP